jgi:hypothetical protein
VPTPDNHEWPRPPEGYDPYWKRVRGKRPAAFYSFRLAAWWLLGLNSEVPHRRGSAQYAGLPVTRTRHLPARLSGTALATAPVLATATNRTWRRSGTRCAGRAAIVVADEHNMQRFQPIAGMSAFVSGAGGHGSYELKRDRRLAFANDGDYGAPRLTLSPRMARFAYVVTDGRILDSGRVACRRAKG